MEELSVDALLPGDVLSDEGLAKPHLGPEIGDVIGRDPRLRHRLADQ